MGIEHDVEKGFNDISQWSSENGNTIAKLQNWLEDPPNVRLAHGLSNRDQQIMTWRLPNGSAVQMYINPQNFGVSESKQISYVRTKGGFVVQYWGDNLINLSLSGTTGSSGVKGVQILRDIYRAENSAFELVAATQQNDLLDIVSENQGLDDADLSQVFSDLASQSRKGAFILRPSLASLALSVALFYQGVQYKGFFTEFSVTEGVDNLGLFDYNMSFMVTEIRGQRKNFMPWHKEPLADDATGQLVSGTINALGNSLRSAFGFPTQYQNPEQFHPESAPLTFGGSTSLAASIGFSQGSRDILPR